MFPNEKGLTLTEVLAGIVLIGIIGTLTTLILVNVFQNEEKTSKDIDLKQATNITISKLRDDFNKTKDGKICLDTQGGQLTFSSVEIQEKENSKEPEEEAVYNSETNCITNLTEDWLNLEVTASILKNNEPIETVEINTTLEKDHTERILSSDDSDLEEPCEFDPSIDWKKVSKLPCSGDNILWNGNDRSQCAAYTFKNLKVDHQADFKNTTIDIEKNGCFNKQTDFHTVTLRAFGSLAFNGQLTFINGTLDGYGKTQFGKQTTFKTMTFRSGQDTTFKKQADFINTNFSTTNGKATFEGQTKFIGGSASIAKKATFLKQTEFKDQNNTTIGGNADFHAQTDFVNQNNTTIVGDANFYAQTTLNNATVNIKQNLFSKSNDFQLDNKSNLRVYKNATFNHQVKLNDGSTLCVQGSVSGGNHSSSQYCTYP